MKGKRFIYWCNRRTGELGKLPYTYVDADVAKQVASKANKDYSNFDHWVVVSIDGEHVVEATAADVRAVEL